MSTQNGAGQQPPRRLGRAGRALFRRILAVYDLDPAEHVLLLQACAVADVIAGLQAHVDAEGVMVEDRFGSSVANPAAVEMRQQLGAFGRLMAALKVQDDVEAAPVGRQRQRGPGAVHGLPGVVGGQR